MPTVQRFTVRTSPDVYAAAMSQGRAFAAGARNSWDNRPGTLWGTGDVSEFSHTPFVKVGRLPREYYESFHAADYAVYSYNTPIAWRNAHTGEWTFPPEKYSATTSNHQSTIRTAVGYLYLDEEWD